MGRITLWGFSKYDPTLFNNIVLPEGMDRDVLIDTIMMESGDLYPYYQHPVYLKKNIENWFARMLPQFEKMLIALTSEYNPIHNFDRFEEYTDNRAIHDITTDNRTHSDNATDNRVMSDNATDNHVIANSSTDNDSSQTTASSTASSTGTREDKVSAYDSDIYRPEANTDSSNNSTQSQTTSGTNIATHSDNGTDDLTHAGSGTDDLTHVGSSTDDLSHSGSTTDDNKHTGHLYGNIGITSSMELVEAELELRKYDLYLSIAKMFEHRFITQVY